MPKSATIIGEAPMSETAPAAGGHRSAVGAPATADLFGFTDLFNLKFLSLKSFGKS